MQDFSIAPVRSPEDLAATARLFDAYVAALGIDLTFQDFAAERAGLPGKYAPPAGELLLARGRTNEPLGCVGLRPFGEAACEMKRLYVDPAARGRGVGQALVGAVLQEARRIGYREMLLDTLATMTDAIGLYRRFGFAPTAPYYHNPIPDTVYLALRLAPGAGAAA